MTETLSIEDADNLVLEHQGWAESIARSVARAWNMDWRSDGLDGAAMEALLFCARRFDPSRAIPFRGYARKRIHEASTDAARKSKNWRRGLSDSAAAAGASEAREISNELLNIFPELRSGELPSFDESQGDSDQDARASVRQLIMGATMVAAHQGISGSSPDELVEFKRLVEFISGMEPVHQCIMWKVYWEGESMRTVAGQWEMDELNIIREHKVLLAHLSKCLSTQRKLEPPRVRPGLRGIALKLKKSSDIGPFKRLIHEARDRSQADEREH